MFTIVNKPLRNLKASKKQLCIDVCKSGRHRSVANGTAQRQIVQDQLYGPESANHTPANKVRLLHLQAHSHWNRLCDDTGQPCALCDPTIPQNRRNMQNAYELLKPLIPLQTRTVPKAVFAPIGGGSVSSQSSGMPSVITTGSIGGTASAKAIAPPDSHIPVKAQPAALSRATQAALSTPKAIGAVPRRTSSQPIPVLAAAAAEAATTRTARTREQSCGSSGTITPRHLHDLHNAPRIVVSKDARQAVTTVLPKESQPVPTIRGTAQASSHSIPSSGTTGNEGTAKSEPRLHRNFRHLPKDALYKADKDHRPQEERTETERSRRTDDIRRDKAESLNRSAAKSVARERAIADIEEEAISIENFKLLADQFREEISVDVINQVCKFYDHEVTFFSLVQRYGTPEKCLLQLCKVHTEITYGQVVDLYHVYDKRSTSSPSTTLNPEGPRQRQASPTPVQAKQKKDKEEKKEDDESNTSDEFKQLQAKCDNPKGTTVVVAITFLPNIDFENSHFSKISFVSPPKAVYTPCAPSAQ